MPLVLDEYDYKFELGKAKLLRDGADVLVISSGLMTMRALEAVKQWEYTPTLLNGVPVPVIMTVTVNFALQ